MPGLKTDAKFPAKDTEKYHLFFNNHFCKISPDLNGKGLSALLVINGLKIYTCFYLDCKSGGDSAERNNCPFIANGAGTEQDRTNKRN